MKAEYLFDFFSEVFIGHNDLHVEEILDRIITLSNSADTFKSEREEISEIINALIVGLHDLDFIRHPLYRESDIDQEGFFRFLGESLGRKLDETNRDHINSRPAFNAAVLNLKSHYSRSIGWVRSIVLAFRSLGLKAFIPPTDRIQIVITFPSSLFSPEIDEFNRELGRVSSTVKEIQLLSEGTRSDIQLDGISGSRIKIFFSLAVPAATMLSAIVNFSLDSVLKIQTAWKAQLEISRIIESNATRPEDKFIDDALRKLSEKCAAKLANDFQFSASADANETSLLAVKSCYDIIKLINDGYSIEFRSKLLQDHGEADAEESDTGKSDRVRQIRMIRTNVEMISNIEATRIPIGQKVIEAPKE